MVAVIDPYAGPGPYRRAQLHTHSDASLDGKWSVRDLVARYGELGFDFVFITDHDQVTKMPPHSPTCSPPGPIVLLGEESTAVNPFWPLGRHMLRLFVTTGAGKWRMPNRPQQLVDDALRQEGMVVISHPSWVGNFGAGRWPLELAAGLAGVHLIEVFNYHSSSQKDTALWDSLLARRSYDNPLWGVAVDDAHHRGRAGIGWVEVRTSGRSAEGLKRALARGAFYATTGLSLDFGAGLDDEREWVVWAARRTVDEVATPLEVRFVRGRGGQSVEWLAPGSLARVTMKLRGDERYVRMEVRGGGCQAWSQPIWVLE